MDLSIQEKQNSFALAPAERVITPGIWKMINEMAPVMYRSRLFGVTSPEAAAAIMLKGFEMGLSITASFELIQVVQGKPGLSPRGALAMLLNSPKIKKIEIKELTKNGQYIGHSCYMQRDNGFEYSVSFTIEDARNAGLIKPQSGWEHYPKNMCQWRAVGFTADVVAPDIVAGMTSIMKMPEEFGVALTEDGDIIDLKSMPTIDQSQTQSVQAEADIPSLDELVAQYGAEAVMVANEGAIPRTNEELVKAAAKLAGGVQ